MSKEHEESIDSDEVNTPDTVSPESDIPQPQQPKCNPKILAIKSALKQKEEEAQQEEMKLYIADKVKKMKSAKENPPEQTVTISETEDRNAEEKTTDSKETEELPQAPKKVKKNKQKKNRKKKSFGTKVRDLFPRKGDGFLETVRKIVFLSSSVIFIICLALIGDYFWDNYKNEQVNKKLRDIYTVTNSQPENTTETDLLGEGYEYYAYLDGAERLLAINPDVVGWISIPGTSINYPLLQRKDQEDGNEYYLKRNIYLEEARAGSIFLDYRNNFDYVIDGRKQAENSQNLVIYGHNMQDYSMFGGLKNYINYADYYSEHPIVELNSNYRMYQYKIFGMIIVDIDDETETKFDYWNQLNFADETEFYNYVNEIKRRTIRLTDVDVQYGDELLTLSTCNSTFSNGRLVIFARKVRDGEDLYEGTESSTANPNVKWSTSYYQWHSNTYDPDAEFVPYG